MLTKYSDVGRPLTAAEVDGNWEAIEAAIADLQTAGVRIAMVRATTDGNGIEFVGTDDSVLGTVAIPTPLVIVGEWETGVSYTTRHIVSHEGVTYLCAEPHVSGSFADDLEDGKWLALGAAGGDGGDGDWEEDEPISMWEVGVDYLVSDLVQYDGATYLCQEAHTSANISDFESSKWALIGYYEPRAQKVFAWGVADTPTEGMTDVQACLDALANAVKSVLDRLDSIEGRLDALDGGEA